MKSKWWKDPKIILPALLTLLLVSLLLFWPQESDAFQTDDRPMAGDTLYWFKFGGHKRQFEIATRDSTIRYNIAYKISGSWVRYEPESGSPDTMQSVFAGLPEYLGPFVPAFQADSTRVRIRPLGDTYGYVRVK